MRLRRSLLVAFLLFGMAAFAQNTTDLVGIWEGMDHSAEKVRFIFDASGSVTMTYAGAKLGGEDFRIHEKPADFKYKLDTNKSPACLDLVVYVKPENREKGRLKILARWLSADEMELALNFTESRPVDFSAANNQVVRLTRITK